MSKLESLKAMTFRKAIHIALSIFLVIPFIADLSIIGLDMTTYFALLTLVASIIYSIQIKRPLITMVIQDVIETARRAVQHQLEPLRDRQDVLSEGLLKLERHFRAILETVERDYERKGGFLGVLMGAIGVTLSCIFTNWYAVYGIVSIIVYDTASALGGVLFGRNRLPMSNATLEGALTGIAALTLTLYLITGNPIDSLIVSLVAAIAEAYGVEDNLSIPVTTSVTAMALKLPLVIH